eukprot:COSAG05_NODE_6892_length_886_cov_1.088945_2_plen_157_part_00
MCRCATLPYIPCNIESVSVFCVHASGRGLNGTVLCGVFAQLRFGFIGVINRSQKSIDEAQRIEESLKAEAEFFGTHPSYANMSSRLGIPYLTKTLSTTLMQHVRSCLPSLRTEITSTTEQLRSQMEEFGGTSWGRMEQVRTETPQNSPRKHRARIA